MKKSTVKPSSKAKPRSSGKSKSHKLSQSSSKSQSSRSNSSRVRTPDPEPQVSGKRSTRAASVNYKEVDTEDELELSDEEETSDGDDSQDDPDYESGEDPFSFRSSKRTSLSAKKKVEVHEHKTTRSTRGTNTKTGSPASQRLQQRNDRLSALINGASSNTRNKANSNNSEVGSRKRTSSKSKNYVFTHRKLSFGHEGDSEMEADLNGSVNTDSPKKTRKKFASEGVLRSSNAGSANLSNGRLVDGTEGGKQLAAANGAAKTTADRNRELHASFFFAKTPKSPASRGKSSTSRLRSGR
eukprot:CAMPEP_0175164000 /NCGR_PEP_ID=MMETSP0087-20121206/26122_1 /TAXON_ID=136419 /ORGANISM="Unknown Unknown, Strain D1" /LENGTH=297 /DNA_ID=CAMNT_0016452887 /DNA_START=400 /DNA_END=1293 /DNA_ORIENTATION=+